MNPWVESFGVLAVAAGGVLAGAWFSRLPRPWWVVGYILPLLVVILVAVGNRQPMFVLTPPISWLFLGHNRFAATAFVAAMVLTVPLGHLPQRRNRIAVTALIICVVCLTSIWPVLAPAFNRAQLAALTTQIDADGVCLQNTDYTCGPAAAVTALRKLGLSADEGEIAILARTSPTFGTPPDILAETLQKRYGDTGVICAYRGFKNLDELRQAGLTLTVVKYNLLLDHYVTVLSVTDEAVTVGDPLNGLTQLTPGEFMAKWCYQGVVIQRNQAKLVE